MKEFSLYTVTIINILVTAIYISLLVKKKIKPTLSMWIFFSIAVVMSLKTYLSEGNYGFLDNIMNTTDLVMVLTISVAIFIFGDKKSRFNRFEVGCLIAVMSIVIFWFFTKNHKLSNLLIQGIMVIAYIPVLRSVLVNKEHNESIIVWIGMLIAPFIALISSKGLLASIYSVRAIICVGVLLILMLRIEFLKSRKTKELLENK